jgi:hypothetical protein
MLGLISLEEEASSRSPEGGSCTWNIRQSVIRAF